MDYARVNFFLSSFLLELSLLEKLGERERNFFLIVYSPDGHNSQIWVTLKPGIRNYLRHLQLLSQLRLPAAKSEAEKPPLAPVL